MATDNSKSDKNIKKITKKTSQISRGVIKTVAGVASTSPKGFVQLAAHAGDNLLKGQFSQTLHDTYTYFINKGEIDPKYFDSTNFADLAPEFGEVQSKPAGVYKLNQIRKMFVNLAKDNGADSHKKYILDIALDMPETEIKVLLADYRLAKEFVPNQPQNFYRSSSNWIDEIAEVSGLKHSSLVMAANQKLIEKRLFNEMTTPSTMNFLPNTGSLTSLGLELCELTTLEDDPIKEYFLEL